MDSIRKTIDKLLVYLRIHSFIYPFAHSFTAHTRTHAHTLRQVHSPTHARSPSHKGPAVQAYRCRHEYRRKLKANQSYW